jgi:hypothetical protein
MSYLLVHITMYVRTEQTRTRRPRVYLLPPVFVTTPSEQRPTGRSGAALCPGERIAATTTLAQRPASRTDGSWGLLVGRLAHSAAPCMVGLGSHRRGCGGYGARHDGRVETRPDHFGLGNQLPGILPAHIRTGWLPCLVVMLAATVPRMWCDHGDVHRWAPSRICGLSAESINPPPGPEDSPRMIHACTHAPLCRPSSKQTGNVIGSAWTGENTAYAHIPSVLVSPQCTHAGIHMQARRRIDIRQTE